ncbi:two-component GAP Byr4 [Schizosaccharomyces cryophilus OY26]|uniref:Two-component GAP Byr4 n=1 Tax=Schizosaccharomyces cryophilus (strain OY26 / ATCC MYA-4695 / CBS 11777 / NBRC 106824 / NRRL Y48691) TaxID=653667 RepID=S9VXN9_SCHCR|nr:two-component GAP Byr4 [Schizosaccharomyces cryophilus OY26]EPY50760.1 two-component GAP Byr4 [Schizosaccharomyces cryophilus OY26]
MTEIESWDDDPDFASDADNVSLFAQSIATTTTSADTTPDDDFSFENSLGRLNSLSLNPSSNSPLLDKSMNSNVCQLHGDSNHKGRVDEYEDDFDFSEGETNSEFQTVRPSHLSSADQNQTIRASHPTTIRPSIHTLAPESDYEPHADTAARSFNSSNSALYDDFDDFSSFENDLEIDPDTDLAEILQRKNRNIDPKSSFSSVEQSSLRTPSSAREEDDFWDDFELDPTEEPETIFRKKAPELNTVNPKHPYISSTIAFHPKVPQETRAYPLCKEIFPSLSNEQAPSSNPPSPSKQHPNSPSKYTQNGFPYSHDTIRASHISSSSKKENPSNFATWTPSSLKQEAQNAHNFYLDIDDLKSAAKTSKYRTRPRHVRKYGDGTELDALEDLPVNYDYENGYQGKLTSSVPKHSHNSSIRPSSTRSKRNDNLLSNITNIQKNDSYNYKGNRKNAVTPSKETTLEALSNDQLNAKTIKSFHKKREPTLIKNLSSPKTPKLVGKMRYNPAKQCWEGNDHAIKDFDAPISPSKPALISNISARKGIQVVGGMVFDPTRFRWINNAEAIDEEPDPFAGLDDLDNEDSVSQSADNSNDSINKSMNSLFSDAGEIYDVGPEFEKKQYTEEKLWRKWVDGWYLSTKRNNLKRLWELYNILNAEQ